MGSTLVSTGDRVVNDNGLKVGVIGAYNLPIIEWTREIDTDTPKPGYLLRAKAGAGGEDKVQSADLKGVNAYAFSEVDFGLIADCNTAYAAGDEIPIIPNNMNDGAILRNVHCADPAGNVNSMTRMTISGTAGLLLQVVEATLQTGSSAGGIFQTITVGTLGAAGTYILPRIHAVQLYYLGDTHAAYQDVMAIVWGG